MENNSENYVKLTPKEHVLKCLDVYVGAINNMNIDDYIFEDNKLIKTKNLINPCILKMFDEGLMNCTDNYIRSNNMRKNRMNYIKVKLLKKNNENIISFKNDGQSIPFNKNNSGIYYPQLIFTEMFTSSNYNDFREGAGKNGIGIKLCNILSKKFIIDIVNDKQRYYQICENNDEIINEPIITKSDKNNYVKIEFIPDFKIIKGLTEEIYNNTLKYIKRRIFDIKMLYEDKLDVFINKTPINYISKYDYIQLLKSTDNQEYKTLKFSDKNFTVYVGLNKKYEYISYINNIYNQDGGIHINNILKQILNGLVTLSNEQDKTKIKQLLKSKLFIFVIGNVINPMFEGQNKSSLKSCDTKIITLTNKNIKQIYDELEIKNIISGKEIDKVNKILNVKTKKLEIEKLIDAEEAGKKNSNKCTLFLCEGDSASSFAKIGMTHKNIGHKYYGCFPLGGKPLNVLNVTDSKILNNKTITNLMKIIGLKHNVKYTDTNNLRYGKIVMLKDADADGASIMGLVLNFFNTLYPELLNIKGFFSEFITPMIKVSIPKNIKVKFNGTGTKVNENNNIVYPFYNVQEYNNFLNDNPSCNKYEVKYVKGLAGNIHNEITRYFEEYNNNCINILMDKDAKESLDKVFNVKRADERKIWLTTLTKETYLPRIAGEPIKCTDFINNDLLSFSYDDCVRSIPNIIDGLKPSQRKILYTSLNKLVDKKMKVFQIGGVVATYAYYHHGDMSMNKTIIKMAQTFTGTNNIPLLRKDGFFGSRTGLGKDAGAPRYISVSLHEITRYIYNKQDDELLTRKTEDNVLVEPEYYVPIIPMLLINGALGIGVGWSSNILSYNYNEIINLVILLLNELELTKININNELLEIKDVPNLYTKKLKPFYRNYNGYIVENKNGYKIYGKYFNKSKQRYNCEISQNDIIVIEEIPFLIAIDDYNKFIEKKINDNIISNCRRTESDINSIKITINVNKDFTMKEFINEFDLVRKISTSNMVGFDCDNKIKRYNDIYEIINEWFVIRWNLYVKRRTNELQKLLNEKLKLENQARFIKMIIEKKLVINKKKKIEIYSDLTEKDFLKINNNYDYLLEMKIDSFTKEKYEILMKHLNECIEKYDNYNEMTICDLWYYELNQLKNMLRELKIDD